MYALIDTTKQHLYSDKEEAQASLTAHEREFGPGFALYGPVVEKTPDQLELLYGLTLQLLKTGKINPVNIRLNITDLLGQETEITALKVINDARAWIDTHVEA